MKRCQAFRLGTAIMIIQANGEIYGPTLNPLWVRPTLYHFDELVCFLVAQQNTFSSESRGILCHTCIPRDDASCHAYSRLG